MLLHIIVLAEFKEKQIRNNDDSNVYAYHDNMSFYADRDTGPNLYINPRLICRLLNMPFSITYLKPVYVLHWVCK